jgi:hypothetical protein
MKHDEKKIEEMIDKYYDNYSGLAYFQAKEIIKQYAEDVRKQTVEEMVELSDKIEMSQPDGGTEQWKAFKHFRNKMRDRL